MTDPTGTTAERKIAPEADIGPFYKVLSFVLLIGDMVMLVFLARGHHSFGWPDAVIQGIVLLLMLALVRPPRFDAAVKTLADKLPGKFTKSDDT